MVLDAPTIVVEGVGAEQLTAGPGRYPGTVMPGEPGNAAIAGHRPALTSTTCHLEHSARQRLVVFAELAS